MQWWYKLLKKTLQEYVYMYSRECKDLDGVLTYDIVSGEAKMIIASASDMGSAKSEAASLRLFYAHVVNEGFPEERHVCCG